MHLIYLHGVGQGDLAESWRKPLDESLRTHGFPGLDQVTVVTPRYAHLLSQTPSPSSEAPRVTSERLSEEEALTARWAYEGRQADLQSYLGTTEDVDSSTIVEDTVVDWGSTIPWGNFRQARSYLRDDGLAACVLLTVLGAIPSRGEAVIVGHSLGSLVAIDLLDHLPPHLRVRRLITIGSPAGNRSLSRSNLQRLSKRFPHKRVESWVNITCRQDPVTLGTGLNPLFPEAMDAYVRLPFPSHGAGEYLGTPLAARAVGSALFPQAAREIVPAIQDPAVPLTAVESAVLLLLRYNQFVAAELRGERKSRFEQAAERVQSRTVATLIERAVEERRPLPKQLLDLRSQAARSVPAVKHLTPEDAVMLLVSLLTSNPISPVEIHVEDGVQRKAVGSLAMSMGLSRSLGQAIFDSLEEAKRTVRSDSAGRWLLGALGLALIFAGPAGLILAAPAGLAGGAAIVGALASFGPGGMIGGLITAGALASAGSGATVAALASTDVGEDTFRTAILHQVASALAFKRLKLRRRTESWLALSHLHSELARERARIAPLSDKDAPSLKVLDRRMGVVDRALAALVKEEVVPTLDRQGK